jgi:diamine N-acetyltransferase
MTVSIELRTVDARNWRACADLEVAPAQRDFVSPVAHYLCLCHYGEVWHPLAVCAGEEVVGFVMWAVDPGDRSGWIGGLVIDEARQRNGYGRATVEALTRRLLETAGCDSCALSYSPENAVARALYTSLGFIETGEQEGDGFVARLSPGGF